MAVVAAALGLRGVERRVQAHRHQGVLQRRSRTRVGVHVAGRHARHAQPAREPLQPPVAGAVAVQERPLQLDAQVLGPERVEQPPQRRLVVHAAQRAPAQADEALGVLEHVIERDERLRGRPPLLPRVRVRACQDPAQVGPAARVLDEQGEVPPRLEIDFGPVDRPQPQRPGRDRELHRARRPSCGRSARAVRDPARARPRPARREATLRRGTRTPNGSGAPRRPYEHMFLLDSDGDAQKPDPQPASHAPWGSAT